MHDESSFTSLEGPVELIDGKLTLTIPIEFGGGLVECSQGIGNVRDEELIIVIPEWLASQLLLVDGSMVTVDNQGGKFNIRKSLIA